jgi:ubiquinone/menaquinone biosynthesis C-methylase UbiE
MDITNIPCPDNCFDAIICNHVLEHIIDDRQAMRELYRTLKSGSWAILQVPLSLSLHKTYEDFSITTTTGREEAFGQSDHVRIYANDYKDRLEQVGFKVKTFQWVTEDENFGGLKNRFGLNEEESVYVVSKP